MSGLPQYQNVFRIAKPDAIKNGIQSPITKRNRQAVSCSACRLRKLKCDRQVPCQSCIKKGDVGSCNYSRNGNQNGRYEPEGTSRASEAQLRLQKLEEMVSSFIQKSKDGNLGSSSAKTTSSLPSSRDSMMDEKFDQLSIHNSSTNHQTATSGGHLDTNGSESTYVGATHWATVLENVSIVLSKVRDRACCGSCVYSSNEVTERYTILQIRDIQGILSPESDDVEESATDIPLSSFPDELDIVVDKNTTLTLTDVHNSLPSRNVIDRLLSIYFNSGNIKMLIIHTGKFLQEYQSFWADPTSVSFLWISIFFSILHISSQIDQANNNALEDLQSSTFLMRAGQALVTGKYQKARPYSVEALILYATCKYMMGEDIDRDAWMITGISARLAMKMGYHRDPRYLANLTPFEGEMRRRTFFMVEMFDLLFSFQAGLPPIIHEEERDTESPSNLLDTDFDEDCKVLPPSRPPNEYTPVLYYSYKSGQARIFRRIIRHALSLKPTSYEETMKLDADLRAKHAEVPPSLQTKPLSSSVADPPYLILDRINIDILFLKSLCVLHRRYISHERSNPAFDPSRTACTDAALRILNYQAELNIACQPGGLFYNTKMRLSSLALHDNLLAAMILSLDLYEAHNRCIPAATTQDLMNSQEADVDAKRKYDAVKLSYEILSSRREFSRDARKASDVLAVMLLKVDNFRSSSSSSTTFTSTYTNRPVDQGEEASSTWELNPITAKTVVNGNRTATTGESYGNPTSTSIPPSSWTMDTEEDRRYDFNSQDLSAPPRLPTQEDERPSMMNGGYDDLLFDLDLNPNPSDPLNLYFGGGSNDGFNNNGNKFDWGLIDQYLLLNQN